MQSSNDYEVKHSEDKGRKGQLRHLNKPTSPTTSKEEEEDEHAFTVVPTSDDLPQPSMAPELEELMDDGDYNPGAPLTLNEGVNDETAWYTKPGPINQEKGAEVFAIKEEYEHCMLALAKRKNVSVHSLFRLVGDKTPKYQAVSAWNAFQKYHTIYHGRPDRGECRFQ